MTEVSKGRLLLISVAASVLSMMLVGLAQYLILGKLNVPIMVVIGGGTGGMIVPLLMSSGKKTQP